MPGLILYHGSLTTQDPDFPHATALALRDGRVLAVGDDAEIRALARRHTRQIDLGGRRVLPGLTDSHARTSARSGRASRSAAWA